ncbi:5'-nucleotidase SurE [bacterium BMS3Abin14]|nr:5'-nucleotidase SurE [bacterium BMS3Abin14]
MIILVTNDDGVNAPGIQALARAMKGLGRVVVAAPDRERSAVSHSLTLHHPLRIERVREDCYAIDGTPTDCIHLGVHVILKGKKPDLIVSGINRGGNLGHNITYSGTVWAAMEGNMMGVPSFAMSLVEAGSLDYGPAGLFALKVGRWVERNGLPEGTILNVNVPDNPRQDLEKFIVTRQGCRQFLESVIEKKDPRERPYFWIGGDQVSVEEDEETDVGAVGRGYISVTPLHSDLTDHDALDAVRSWNGVRERKDNT